MNSESEKNGQGSSLPEDTLPRSHRDRDAELSLLLRPASRVHLSTMEAARQRGAAEMNKGVSRQSSAWGDASLFTTPFKTEF